LIVVTRILQIEKFKGFMKTIRWMRLSFAALSLVLLVAGCVTGTTVQSRKGERFSAYQALNPEMRAAVDAGQLKAGMNMDAVYIAWGKPSQILQGGSETGETTTWVYRGTYTQQTEIWGYWRMHYAYATISYTRAQAIFTNGVVTRWDTFPSPSGY
jgi:hypothetical protein